MVREFGSGEETRRGYITYIAKATKKLKHKEIEYAIVNGRATFEGDIVIDTEESIAEAEREGAERMAAGEIYDEVPESRRPGDVVMDGGRQEAVIIVGSQYRWPNGRIPYTIDPNLSDQQRVTDAIAHWEEETWVRFNERQDETDYVTFIPDPDGCWSSVGRRGGQQFVGLHPWCTTGNTIHEIGHTVGLWHEQSREDRDDYVTLHWENIKEGREHNFNQHIADGDDVGPYDYGSIMHYPRDAFSISGQDTITPPQGVVIGQREHLSEADVAAVIFMYGWGSYYIGNARSKELHVPTCRWAKLIRPYNLRYLTTVESAKQQGYNGCYHCLRYWDTG
jgi:hypothetical protein